MLIPECSQGAVETAKEESDQASGWQLLLERDPSSVSPQALSPS